MKPSSTSLIQLLPSKFFISATRSFLNANGRRQINASAYRKPAKVSGGISFKPILIITKEVDQRNVTSRAIRIDAVREKCLVRIFHL